MSNVNRFTPEQREEQRAFEKSLMGKYYGLNAVQRVIAAREQAPPEKVEPEKKRSVRRKFGRGKG